MKKALLPIALALAAGAVWFVLSSPRDEAEVDSLAAKPPPRAERAPPSRDVELDALLSEILREPVESGRADAVDGEPVAAATAGSREAREETLATEQSLAPSKLILLDREPNLLRVEALVGPVIQRRWPNGALMLEARQTLNENGFWALDGGWRAWFPDGVLEELGEYRDDLEHGRWTWFWANGTVQAEGEFDHGVRVGCWKFWHPNGVVIGEGCYESGARSGRWTFRRGDGSVISDYSGEYREGYRVP